jgi:SAM-dependent methyltransferase
VAPVRLRPRLSRTLSRNRLDEYASLLASARRSGYVTVSLEDWIDGAGGRGKPTLILRHDVDQHPRSALAMAAVERDAGVDSTWYFRWRTADPEVISRLRAEGFQIGLHYETLTRRVRAGLVDEGDLDAAREELAEEIAAFSRLHGPIRSIAPHGDTRAPGVSNADLVRGRGTEDLGVEFDGNQAMASRRVKVWLTDRSVAEGGWRDGIRPEELLERRESRILCLTHPNNWASGPGLWLDRAISAGLPSPAPDRPGRPLRTRSDRPPRGETGPVPPSPAASDFAPIAASLRSQVTHHYERSGEPLEGRAGRVTLETNSSLAERRGELLLRLLRERGAPVEDARLLDLGCGFGALSLFFALRGARVVAIDSNGPRLRVGRRVAEAHDLRVRFRRQSMQDLSFRDEGFDLAVMNNSLCYVADPGDRAASLAEAHRVLRPGGLLVIRNPNRLHPVDQFSGLPLIGVLPSGAANRAAGLLGRPRSRVRLRSNAGAARELRAAGFDEIRVHSQPSARRPAWRAVARYQHLTARRR